MKAKADYPDRLQPDRMVLGAVRRGSWTAWGMAKGNSRGAVRLESSQVRRFSWWPGWEAGTLWGGGQRHWKSKLSSRGGGIRLESMQIRCFLWWPHKRLDCINGGQRRSTERVGKQL
jgi:hypothetical protein